MTTSSLLEALHCPGNKIGLRYFDYSKNLYPLNLTAFFTWARILLASCVLWRKTYVLTYKITTYRNGTNISGATGPGNRSDYWNRICPTFFLHVPSPTFAFLLYSSELCSPKEASWFSLFSHLLKLLEDAVVCLKRTIPGDCLSKPDLSAFKVLEKAACLDCEYWRVSP